MRVTRILDKVVIETEIYNILKNIGEIKNEWDEWDAQGKIIPTGIYFLKLNGKYAGKVVKVRWERALYNQWSATKKMQIGNNIYKIV